MSAAPAPDSPPDRRLPAAAWVAVAVLAVAGGSNYLTRTMLTTMRSSVLQDIPMSDAEFGLLTTSFLWCYAIACPFGGFVADRFSRKLVISVSVVAWAALTLATLAASSFGGFALSRALLGFAQAFYIPAAVALIVDFHRGATRSFAGGLHLVGLVAGSTLGGVGGVLAEHHGWRFAYAAVGIPTLLLGLALYFILREPPRENVSPGTTDSIRLGAALRSLAQPGPYYPLFIGMAVQGAVSWIIIGWMPTLMRERFHLGQGAAGFSALGFLYGPQIFGLLVGGLISDRLSLINARSRIIIPAVAVIGTAPLFFFNAWSQHLSLMMLSLSLYGAAMGFLGANTMPIVCLVADARYRATAVGVLNCCTAICGGVAVYGVGALRDADVSLNAILFIAAVGVLACGACLWLVNVGVRRAEAASPHA